MRSYAKVAPQFWIGDTGRKLPQAGTETMLVALYLVTCAHANMIGLYYLPTTYIGHETGLGSERASEGLRRAIDAGFCDYDDGAEVVFVYAMARFQIAEGLDRRDKRCVGVQREYDALPDNRFLADFFRRYANVFHMNNPRGDANLEGPPGGHRSHEQEQEQEQEQKQEQEHERKTKPSGSDETVEEIWNYYVEKIKKNSSLYRFTAERRAKGKARLQECLRMAAEPRLPNAAGMMRVCIDRLAASGFHNGQNKDGKKYLDWSDHLFPSEKKLTFWLDDDLHKERRDR